MSAVRLARLGDLEVASSSVAGQQFDKHSHDEFVIGANLLGEERIWLDGRSFSAGVGAITTYNPGEIQGGGVAEGRPWRYVSLYVPAAQLADRLGRADLQFERPVQQAPHLARELACGGGLFERRRAVARAWRRGRDPAARTHRRGSRRVP